MIGLLARRRENLEKIEVPSDCVLYFDGINNTLNGHDSTATTWKNLGTGGSTYDIGFDSTIYGFESNCINALATGQGIDIKYNSLISNNFSLFIILSGNELSQSNVFISNNIYVVRTYQSKLMVLYSGTTIFQVTYNNRNVKMAVLIRVSSDKITINIGNSVYTASHENYSAVSTNHFYIYAYNAKNWFKTKRIYTFRIYERCITDAEANVLLNTEKTRYGL